MRLPWRVVRRSSGLPCRPVVQCAEELGYEPDAVVGGVVEPGAPEHDELDLVGCVSHLLERMQPVRHLPIGIELVERRSLAGGLIGEVAFRHGGVVRAVYARVRARPGLRDHRDGRHSRCTASRLHLQRLHEPLV